LEEVPIKVRMDIYCPVTWREQTYITGCVKLEKHYTYSFN
jgi:hypothetical protein